MAESKKSTPETTPEFNYGADGSPNDYKPTYYGDDAMPKNSPSNKVYHDKTPAATMGSGKDQPCQYEYPGRALPPVNNSVPDAKCEEGTCVRLGKQQRGLNRYPINEHVEKHKSHGPNN
jgi:hypothetical protein